MNPNDPICTGFTKQIERKDSIAIAIFNKSGDAMQEFLKRNPPTDLDMLTSEFGKFCVFLRPGVDAEYQQHMESIADLYLDTVNFKVTRFVPGAFLGMPDSNEPSYELIYEYLKEDKELRWVIPRSVDVFWNAVHRMWTREQNLRNRLMVLGIHPGEATEYIADDMLMTDEQKINGYWTYVIRLDKNIRTLDAQVKTAEETSRNSKLIHLAKIADNY